MKKSIKTFNNFINCIFYRCGKNCRNPYSTFPCFYFAWNIRKKTIREKAQVRDDKNRHLLCACPQVLSKAYRLSALQLIFSYHMITLLNYDVKKMIMMQQATVPLEPLKQWAWLTT